MITLPAPFALANSRDKKQPDILVAIEDKTLFAEKATEIDWGNSTSETDVDYTPPPGISGDVQLNFPDTWDAGLTDATTGRAYHAAIEYNGKIYFFGGFTTGYTQDVRIYDIAGDSWSSGTSGGGARIEHSAVEHNGKVYIFGGYTGAGRLKDVQIYDIAGDSWSSGTSGATIRSEHSAVEHNGKMYIYGGTNGASTLNTLWEYDIPGDSWTQLTSGGGSNGRRDHVAIVYDGKMYIHGGVNAVTSELNTLWGYDITGVSWTQLASGGVARHGHSAIEYAGEMYIFGGTDASTIITNPYKFDPISNTWFQLTDGSTLRDGHSAIEYSGKMYVFGGWNISIFTKDIWSHDMGYSATGSITTDNLDLGEVPEYVGEWVIQDIAPGDTALTYTAEYSTTGVWGGEEVSIGVITDGLALTVLARYWRVEASFVSSTLRDKTPILQSVRADYTTYRKFNKVADLGYEPLVDGVSSLTSKVDFFDPASIGKISVQLVMTPAISIWVDSDTLFNKIVKVKLGYVYPGLDESHYIDYFTGAVDDWPVNGGILDLQLKDLSKDWKLPVPEKWEDSGDNIIWEDIHHADIMLDIFQNNINVRDSGLLLDSFTTAKAATPGYRATRTITKKTIDAKKLVEELRLLLWGFFLPRGDGKIKLKLFDKTEATVHTFTDDNAKSIKWRPNSEGLINRTALYSDWDGLGDDEENFGEYNPGDSGTSQTEFRAIIPFELKDKWTKPAQASQIADLETKILDQFDAMPSIVDIEDDISSIAVEAGDQVLVTTKNAPGSGGTGIVDVRFLITSKNLDFEGSKINYEALRVTI